MLWARTENIFDRPVFCIWVGVSFVCFFFLLLSEEETTHLCQSLPCWWGHLGSRGSKFCQACHLCWPWGMMPSLHIPEIVMVYPYSVASSVSVVHRVRVYCQPRRRGWLLVAPFVHPVHAHRAILVAMAVARLSGHFSSLPPFHTLLPDVFLPLRLSSAPRMTPCPPARTCWVWGSPRWDAPTPCQTTATCSSRPTPAPALLPWATGSRHITSSNQVHVPQLGQEWDFPIEKELWFSKVFGRREKTATGFQSCVQTCVTAVKRPSTTCKGPPQFTKPCLR